MHFLCLVVMNFMQIRYFLSLADEVDNMVNGSKRKNSVPLSLQRQIRLLERKLDVKLFEPHRQNLLLTTAGAFLKKKWRPMLDHFDSIHAFAKDIESGETNSVRALYTDCINKAVVQELFSEISESFSPLDLSMEVTAYDNALESLMEYKADLVLTREKSSAAPIIGSRKILSEPFCLVVPTDHPFHSEDDIRRDGQQEYKMIQPVSEPGSRYTSSMKEIFMTYDLPSPFLLGNGLPYSLPDLIRKGAGISVQPFSFSYTHGVEEGLRFIKLPFETDLFINWRIEDNGPVLQQLLQGI